jgi:hypothetical protein
MAEMPPFGLERRWTTFFFKSASSTPEGKKVKRPLRVIRPRCISAGIDHQFHHHISGLQIKLHVFVWHFSFNTIARVANLSDPNKRRLFV